MKSLNLSRRAILIAALSLLATAGIVLAAATYSYKCPKCGLIQTYDRPSPGVKCPKDGWIMSPQ